LAGRAVLSMHDKVAMDYLSIVSYKERTRSVMTNFRAEFPAGDPSFEATLWIRR